jgi:hypothetical protein
MDTQNFKAAKGFITILVFLQARIDEKARCLNT